MSRISAECRLLGLPLRSADSAGVRLSAAVASAEKGEAEECATEEQARAGLGIAKGQVIERELGSGVGKRDGGAGNRGTIILKVPLRKH